MVKEARKEGWDLVAVYHSHPGTPARMSEEDIHLAFDSEMIYVIYSVVEDKIHAFKVRDRKIYEEQIKVKKQ